VIPQLLTVHIRPPDGRPVRIWLPVLPLALLFLPILVLAALAAVVACVIYRVSVLRAFSRGWRLVSALRGTRVDIEQGSTAVLVAIR
jgi:hypothetical protein